MHEVRKSTCRQKEQVSDGEIYDRDSDDGDHVDDALKNSKKSGGPINLTSRFRPRSQIAARPII